MNNKEATTNQETNIEETDAKETNSQKDIETNLKTSQNIADTFQKKEGLIAIGIKELRKTFFSPTKNSNEKNKRQISKLEENFEEKLIKERAHQSEE